MKYFCGKFWCAYVSRICNFFLHYCRLEVKITRPKIQGLSSNDFYTISPPLNGIQKGEYTPNTPRSSCLQILYK